MEPPTDYIKYVDQIPKEEFIRLFSGTGMAEKWFTDAELEKFSMAKNSASLAARYLIKKRICLELDVQGQEREIWILNDQFGKPEIGLGEDLQKVLSEAGFKSILCSISHSRNFIAGMTVFCK